MSDLFPNFHNIKLNHTMSFSTKPVNFLPVLALGYCHCLRLCVCVNPLFVCTITRDPFKIGSLNLDQRYKTPRLRSFVEQSTLTFKMKFNLKSKFNTFWACLHHNSPSFKLGSPNLDQTCILIQLRSLLFSGDGIPLGLQG